MSLHNFIFSFSLIIFSFSFGQNFSYSEFENEKDSARRVEMGLLGLQYYRKNNLDSLRVLALNFASLDSSNNNSDKSFDYGLSRRFFGALAIRSEDIKLGVTLLVEAGEIFANNSSPILLSETENDIGNAYFLMGNYDQAVNYYFKSIVHGTNSSDGTASYNGMIGLGKTLCSTGDTARGLLFIQKYLERSLRDSKYEAAADASGYLGMIAGKKGKIKLMSAYYTRANLYAGRSSSKTHHANALTNKAINHFYNNKLDSSIYLFNQSLKMREEVGATRPIVESLYNLAILYIETDSLDNAKKYAKRGETLSAERGIRSWQLDCLRLLLEIAEKSNDLSDVESIKFDIERIERELKEMSSVNTEIVDVAVDFTSLHDYPIRRSRFWELFSGFVILICAILLMYANRPNSTLEGTRV